MAYSNTVKFIIFGILLVIIAFAIGMVLNVSRGGASQQRLQACTDYQQTVAASGSAKSYCSGQ